MSGGDFTTSNEEFTFSAAETTPCIDVFIFEDQLFEGDEDFMVMFDSFRLADGTTTNSMTGVTVNPSSSTVTIEDSSSKSYLYLEIVTVRNWSNKLFVFHYMPSCVFYM